MNKDKKLKGIKIDKDRLKINGSFDDVLKVSVPKKPKDKK
jgi:hypothetical protein